MRAFQATAAMVGLAMVSGVCFWFLGASRAQAPARGQAAAARQDEERTQFEEAKRARGALIAKDSYFIGRLPSKYRGQLTVEAGRVYRVGQATKGAEGFVLTREAVDKYDSPEVGVVDLEDVPGLIAALEQLKEVVEKARKRDGGTISAEYHVKGGVEVGFLSSETTGETAYVNTGPFSRKTFFFDPADFDTLISLLRHAVEKLKQTKPVLGV